MVRILLPLILVFTSQLPGPLARADTPNSDKLDDVLSGFEQPEGPGNPGEEFSEDVDGLLSEFDDPDDFRDTSSATNSSAAKRNWRISGDLSLTLTYNYAHDRPEPEKTDYRGLSQLRAQFRPELLLDIMPGWDAKVSGSGFYDFAYRINGTSDYTHEVLNEYENEAELRETFIRGRINTRLDLKIGRQIIAWGKSDNLRVVDVLNPLDQREPGLVDIEDLRLPLTMARLDYFLGNWSLSAIGIHEIRFDKQPAFGSDFYPSRVKLPPEKSPTDGGSNTEFAAALSGVLQGWDISFHLARIFNDESHLAMDKGGELQRQHSRLDMLGITTNIVMGNWLWKAEAAHFTGIEFFPISDEEFDRTDLMLGLEYNGFDNTTLSLESLVRHLHDYDPILEHAPVPTERNRVQTAFRYNADFLHERLNVVLLVMRHGEDLGKGGFTRLQFKYELRDALFVTLGAINFHRGRTRPFPIISNNDRLFLDLQYSF